MSTDPMPWLIPLPPQPDDPVGLMGIGREVSPRAILGGARRGMFPWTGRYPVPWCSPDPRAVFEPGQIRRPRSLRKSIKNRGYEVTFDISFADVVTRCARTPRPGQPGTWLTPNLAQAWLELHQQGRYHSVEVWQDGVLVGGLVGLALGRAFFGDSMFHHTRDASKVAFVTLCAALHQAGYTLVDGQMPTPHLVSLGARSVPRGAFLEVLGAALSHEVAPGLWADGIPPT